ncbi:MAG: MltA domain-containing protein [Salinarimonas sp.]|nr:MltA domain-containing protein [Salinarimonas sp.]
MAAVFLAGTAAPETTAAQARERAELIPVDFAALAGWEDDDHDAAFAAFLRSCDGPARDAPDNTVTLRPGIALGDDLARICEAARSWQGEARAFFEAHFSPHRIIPNEGRPFLTGYYEPEYDGSRAPHPDFPAPLRARPPDLVTRNAENPLPGIDESLAAARRLPDGSHVPYPDRAAIMDGAIDALAPPIVHLRHPAQAFIIHVQGSARIRLADGSVMRVGYAGRNGHPFTAIGRLLVERDVIPLEEMSLERLLGWLEAPENAKAADALMRENRSYIFFAENPVLGAESGPVGGAGVALTAHRSLAVDRTIWPYGLPVWLSGTLPDADNRPQPLAQLMIAQDTGSAITGVARGDYFAGSGDEAGRQAGHIRHRPEFIVLLPRRAED